VATTLRTPPGLSPGGRALWREIADEHDLDAAQKVQLLEACRAKDRLDKLDELLRGDVDRWADLVEKRGGAMTELQIDDALGKANSTANLLKQLLAALRLPDEATGKKPQKRAARGAYKPRAGTVSSLDRARAAKSS
jgi:hypothetical protein